MTAQNEGTNPLSPDNAFFEVDRLFRQVQPLLRQSVHLIEATGWGLARLTAEEEHSAGTMTTLLTEVQSCIKNAWIIMARYHSDHERKYEASLSKNQEDLPPWDDE